MRSKQGEAAAMHKRSKSASDSNNGGRRDKLDSAPQSFSLLGWDNMRMTEGQCAIRYRPLLGKNIQGSFMSEVQQLEKHLKNQFDIRNALESALGYKSHSNSSSNDISIPKATKELVREISVLEFEVAYLEQYLLSLYQKAFQRQKFDSFLPLMEEMPGRLSSSQFESAQSSQMAPPLRKSVTNSECGSYESTCKEKHTLPQFHHKPSSHLHQASVSSRISPSMENLDSSPCEFYSQPLLHSKEPNIGITSLGDYLGANIVFHAPEASNSISEEMVRCIGTVYCKIADSPTIWNGSISSSSSFSSSNAYSPNHVGGAWSPGSRRGSTIDGLLEKSINFEGFEETSRSCNGLFEITSINTKNLKLQDVGSMLQYYKSLVHHLRRVDPRKMNNIEKLAFWINIYNSMMMHLFIEHGVPHNNMKRAFLSTKTSYLIGGCSITSDIIQSSILRCRTHRPGQWLRAMLSTRMKSRAGDDCQSFAIEKCEPLVHFALSSGCHSDPPLRVYSPRGLYQELEAAKGDYLCSSWIHEEESLKKTKIVLPKLIDYFAREMDLNQQSLLELIQLCVPEAAAAVAKQRSGKASSLQKRIEWAPHNFGFRYLIVSDFLAR